jgi:Flp pilus assembly pilin Flp
MFKKLMKNKKAQQTAEYALLISLVVAAIIAMQTYAQRTIQARIRDASAQLTKSTSALGNTAQYEPYYLETSYETFRNETTEQIQEGGTAADGSDASFKTTEDSVRTRAEGGFQVSAYNNAMFIKDGGF